MIYCVNNRCSVTFGTSHAFLEALDDFQTKIKQNFFITIKSIVRIKNGFNAIKQWKSMNNAEYCDLKLNVIILDPINRINMIGEIQFLLRWLLGMFYTKTIKNVSVNYCDFFPLCVHFSNWSLFIYFLIILFCGCVVLALLGT